MRKREYLPLIICWVFYFLLCIAFINYVGDNYNRKKSVLAERKQQIGVELETAMLSPEELEENFSEAATEEEDTSLAEVDNEEINQLIQTVLQAMADGDAKTLRLFDAYPKTYDDEESLKRGAEMIEEYKNVKNYFKKGLFTDTYFIFTTADMKIKGCETLAPSMLEFYVVKKEDGKFIIDTTPTDDMDVAVSNYMVKMQNENDVLQLVETVNQSFASACQNDKNLKKIVTGQS